MGVWVIEQRAIILSATVRSPTVCIISKVLITHCVPVTAYICLSKLYNIGSDNGLSPAQHQAIIWTNAGILLIWLLGTNFSEMLIEIIKFSFRRMHLKVPSAKHRSFCFGLNVLKPHFLAWTLLSHVLSVWIWVLFHCKDAVWSYVSVFRIHTMETKWP